MDGKISLYSDTIDLIRSFTISTYECKSNIIRSLAFNFGSILLSMGSGEMFEISATDGHLMGGQFILSTPGNGKNLDFALHNKRPEIYYLNESKIITAYNFKTHKFLMNNKFLNNYSISSICIDHIRGKIILGTSNTKEGNVLMVVDVNFHLI